MLFYNLGGAARAKAWYRTARSPRSHDLEGRGTWSGGIRGQEVK